LADAFPALFAPVVDLSHPLCVLPGRFSSAFLALLGRMRTLCSPFVRARLSLNGQFPFPPGALLGQSFALLCALGRLRECCVSK
jgi:hypothetical protein